MEKNPVGRPKGGKNPNAGTKKTVLTEEGVEFGIRIEKSIHDKFGKKKCREIARNAIRAVYDAEMEIE